MVGAGLAGAKAAQRLRQEGFDGRVVVVGEEDVRPYDRPPLSKAYLRGGVGFDKVALHKANFYEARDIELLTGTRAVALDVAARQVELSSGGRLGYDQLLLATGASPRRLAIPGGDLPGVCYLRDLHDAERLRDALAAGAAAGGARAVVVGAGWIGCEVAASARQLGVDVALVDVLAAPLERVLGPEVGALYARLHAEHGVRLRMGVGVEALRGGASVEEVALGDGSVLPAEVVVIGVGVAPRVGLARDAGLEVANGVVVDEHLATSAPGVWAAGDVASAYHPRYRSHIRLEHWAAALHQGSTAATNMLGGRVAYDRTPYFWSDQYELGMEYSGYAPTWDEVVLRGEMGKGDLLAFWLSGGRVAAAMFANAEEAADQVEELVRSGRVVDPASLADPAVALADLVGRG